MKVNKRYFETVQNENDSSPDSKLETKPDIKKIKLKKNKHQVKKPIVIKTNLSQYAIKKHFNNNQFKLKKEVVDPKLVAKYQRGNGISNFNRIKTKFRAQKIEKKEKAIEWSAKQAARAELLLTEDSGLLQADAGEITTQYRQKQIVENVDITAATKHFQLHLKEFGPYRLKYTKNGRHLLLGGERGHVAAFDWITKRLHCEVNVLESVYDICWLHIETMFAVAQKKWVYMYDNQGIELHCVKKLNNVLRMEFLPYHFLLATASDLGFLSWLDISIGEMVTHYNTRLGRLSLMTQNPYNALLCLGHSKGIVTMWSPNVNEPIAKMLCHKSPLTGIAVNPSGTYMATSAVEKSLKIWDIRKLSGPIQHYKLLTAPQNLTFSQKNLLALGMENVVEVYRDCCTQTVKGAYLRHRIDASVNHLQFCPYEDVLGVGSSGGFTSLIIPGSGEPNFDAFEGNPFQTKSQRRENEVKALLEKIPSDLICLDPNSVAEVDVPTLQSKLELKKQLAHVKTPKVNIQPRNKNKLRGNSVKMAKTKKILQEAAKRDYIKSVKETDDHSSIKKSKKKNSQKDDILDRFKPSKR